MKKIYSLMMVLMCLISTKAFATYEKIDGTTVWGYYTADNLDDKDVIKAAQVQEAKVDLYLGIEVPGNGALLGSTIQAVNLPINKKSELSKFYLFIMDADKETVLYEQQVDVSKFSDWALNTVKLDTPFTIDRDLLVGMRFHGTSVNGGASVQCVLTAKSYKYAGSMWYKETTTWYDLHNTYGALPIQLQVSGATTGDMMAYINSHSGNTAPDSRVVYNATVTADCVKDVTDITYTVTVDGKSETYDTEVPISAGTSQTNQVEIYYHSPAAAGPYTVALTIDKINGEENALKSHVTEWKMNNVSRKVERNTVMEEFSGTLCGNCVRGFAGIETLYNYYPDNFIAISYHSYPSDPMALTSYPLTNSDYPSCQMDRGGSFIDPFFGSSTDHACEGIVVDFNNCQEVIPTIDVKATPEWTDENLKQVSIKANVEALTEGKYSVMYLLTADNLNRSNWVQYNTAYKYSQEAWHGNDYFGVYCAGGELGKEYIQIPFNDVCIAHSCVDEKDGEYTEHVNKGETATLQMGEVLEGNYTLTLPTGSDYYNAIMEQLGKIYAVVVVLNSDGTVANACKVRVPVPEGHEDAISTVAESTQEVARYTLDGRRASAAQHGPVIVKYADGKSRVVVSK